METTQVKIKPNPLASKIIPPIPISLPDHTQLPESDGTFVKNFQEHPQSLVLTSSIEPILQKLHPDGRYCIGQDSGIYWNLTEPPEKGAEAPDWFYVPNVPPFLNGEYRRSYVMWKEIVAPLIAIEFVSGNGSEERDASPPPENEEDIDLKTVKKKKAGKFWVYEQAIRIPYYGIYDVRKAAIDLYHLVGGKYERLESNERGHFPIAPLGVELGILLGAEATPIPWLRFWDEDGNLLLTGDERAIAEKQARLLAEQAQQQAEQAQLLAEQAQQQAEQAQQQAEAIAEQAHFAQQKAEQKANRLAEMLRTLGVNPDQI
jgi:Uma2 family endonuclease